MTVETEKPASNEATNDKSESAKAPTNDAVTLKVSCFCGDRTLTVSVPFTNPTPGTPLKDVPGDALPSPMMSCICHCSICRGLHGAAFVHFIGFEEDQVRGEL